MARRPVQMGQEGSHVIAERILMGLLIGGIALGCGFVLYPFFSALLWAAILVFATWPAFAWLTRTTHLPRGLAALLMVLLTALTLVLPLGACRARGCGGHHGPARFPSKPGCRPFRRRRTGSTPCPWRGRA